jgi:hypothetical protein
VNRVLSGILAGTIDGYAYELGIAFEILMRGDGWPIPLEHAKSEESQIDAYRQHKDNLTLNAAIRAKAVAIARDA